jgi:mitochondrial FAD-linked sulfhydryl oxidase
MIFAALSEDFLTNFQLIGMSELLPFQADAEESAQNGKGKRLPSGVVLDKDGKPCKTCTAFRDLLNLPSKRPTPSIQSRQQIQQPAHCPPDVEVLGRATWTFLHTLAANYPEKPSVQQQSEMSGFIGTLGRFYPCWHCADDFRAWMAKGNEPKTQSRGDFEKWMCQAHNEVNKKLGKDTFDCSPRSLNIRWRDGPSDGSCG